MERPSVEEVVCEPAKGAVKQEAEAAEAAAAEQSEATVAADNDEAEWQARIAATEARRREATLAAAKSRQAQAMARRDAESSRVDARAAFQRARREAEARRIQDLSGLLQARQSVADDEKKAEGAAFGMRLDAMTGADETAFAVEVAEGMARVVKRAETALVDGDSGEGGEEEDDVESPEEADDSLSREEVAALGVVALRGELHKRGLKVSGVKAALVARLLGEPEPEPSAAVAAPERDLADVVDSLSSLKVAELKELCRVRGLRVGGKKADLVARLEEHRQAGAMGCEAGTTVNPVDISETRVQ